MPDIEQIRQEVPAVLSTTFLNTGTCGPLPRVAHEAILKAAAVQFEQGSARIGPDHFPILGEAKEAVRENAARALGADVDEVAVTNSTTDGMYIGILGYRWQAGDELILSNIEHGGGGYTPTYLAKRRHGITIRMADIGIGDGDAASIVEAFEQQITPRTRMIVLSHVSYLTGALLPLKEITEMAREYHVLTVVDAAQTYGAMQLDMHDLGIDVYAGPGQKWMCGPDGTGAAYVRAASTGFFEQGLNHAGSIAGSLDFFGGSYAPPAGARRFDTTSRNSALLDGQNAATTWVLDTVGLEWANQRIQDLGSTTYAELNRLDGVQVVTPEHAMLGLIAFTVDGIEPPDLRTRLVDEHNVTIRFVTKYINNPDAARVSIGFYNNEEDIGKLIEGIQAIQHSL